MSIVFDNFLNTFKRSEWSSFNILLSVVIPKPHNLQNFDFERLCSFIKSRIIFLLKLDDMFFLP